MAHLDSLSLAIASRTVRNSGVSPPAGFALFFPAIFAPIFPRKALISCTFPPFSMPDFT
jgi:hypothetical protein